MIVWTFGHASCRLPLMRPGQATEIAYTSNAQLYLMTKRVKKTIRAIILTCFYWIRSADRSTVHHAALCGTLQSRRKCCRGAVRPCSGAFLIKCVKLVICQMLHRICRHLFTNAERCTQAAKGAPLQA